MDSLAELLQTLKAAGVRHYSDGKYTIDFDPPETDWSSEAQEEPKLNMADAHFFD